MSQYQQLYDDDSTRPIVHGLIAAIGYIKGSSVNNAAVMTAALNVALKALEELQEKRKTEMERISKLAHLWHEMADYFPDGTDYEDRSEALHQCARQLNEVMDQLKGKP